MSPPPGKPAPPQRFKALRRRLWFVSTFLVPSADERSEAADQLKGLWSSLGRVRPGAAFRGFGSLRWRCRESDAFRHFLLGLPSMVAAAAVFAFAFEAVVTSKAEVAVRYLNEGDARFQAKDYPAARACYERLVLMHPSNQEPRYRLALTLDALGQQPGRVAGLMNGLAPEDAPGYAPARLWLAERSMAARPPSPASYQAAESHLKSVLKLQPGSAEARALLAQLFSVTGRAREAEEALTDVVDDRPDLLLLLAQVCKLQGNTEAADRRGNEALRHYQRAVKDHPDDPKARTYLALSECYFGRFARAEAVLLERRGGTRGPLLVGTLSQVYALWFDALLREEGDTVGPRMALLERGLSADPASPGLLQRLALAVESGGPAADRARDALQTVLATGKATGTTHMVLGIDAWARGKPDEAAVHFERAYQLSPEAPTIANNLAWVLATGPRPDPPRALSLIDRVIERAPNVANFHDTRGFILLRMKRWKDALPDLEAALQVDRPRPALHLALAEAYDNLKMPDVAAKHRLQAEAAPCPENRIDASTPSDRSGP